MTILLVDDHPIVLEGIKTLLSPLCGIAFVVATSASKAMEVISKGKVDIMITDLELNDGSGLSLIDYLHNQQPNAKTAIYTLHEEAWTICDIRDCDPDAVVMKGDNPLELVKAVEALVAGYGYYSTTFCKMLTLANSMPERLSKRELQVLAMTAKGLSTKETATRMGVSANTVEFHRRRIMMKLHVSNVVEMVMRARELGWSSLETHPF